MDRIYIIHLFCIEENGGLHPTSNYTTDQDNRVRRKEAAENIFLKLEIYIARAKQGRKFCTISKFRDQKTAILTYFQALMVKNRSVVCVTLSLLCLWIGRKLKNKA